MIPTELYGAVQYPSDFGRAAAIGVLVMIVTVAFTILQRRYLGRRRYETVSGKGYKPRIIHLKGWRKVAALAVEIIYIGSGVVLPIIALLMVSFSSIWTGTLNTRMLTLDNYSYVLFGYGLTQRAIANSLYLALVGATILLYAQGTETISVALVILSERNFGYVSALAVIQLVLLLGAFALFRITRTSIVQS
jgi:iron(III) transport system permease protein